ncbi:hypothetical protein LTR09_012125 [Extremus antarcticus]|uniref:BZIP domain-containing protein n=1 Tax=Extremus antarcticus TaxID=702011 RepID=A0AAJ0D562_9PEZI|nr:hypothetical protein LTR09_012125 [Extremus antarcticus]
MDETKAEDKYKDDQTKATSVERVKNRLAAAKCRAKKKATSKKMQDVHREGARTNYYLQREVRELRDQKAFLRNALLCHEPGMCQCNAIHRFNMAQAQRLAMVGSGTIPLAISPSQESISSINTPELDISSARTRFTSVSDSAGSSNG